MAAQDMMRHEGQRHDGGPLERSHLKDMVQRNAIEQVAHTKKAKHLESQKKAFERQNTRDNEEMRSLLQRLQSSTQQTAHLDDELSYDSDEDSCSLCEDEVDGGAATPRVQSANPYPVTIVPKFGGTSQTPRSQSRVSVTHRAADDLQDSLSSLSIHGRCSVASMMTESQTATALSHNGDQPGEWLAHPDAISSVRRQRKSVNEQSHRKYKMRSGDTSESSAGSASGSPTHSRSNSLKEKKKSVAGVEEFDTRAVGVGRRGGSLKERRHGSTVAPDLYDSRQKPAARSFSMLTKCSLQEFDQRLNERRATRKTSDRSVYGVDYTGAKSGKSTPRGGSLKVKKTSVDSTSENGPISRKSPRKNEKKSVQGRLEGNDTSISSSIGSNNGKKVASSYSFDMSPATSPSLQDTGVYKF